MMFLYSNKPSLFVFVVWFSSRSVSIVFGSGTCDSESTTLPCIEPLTMAVGSSWIIRVLKYVSTKFGCVWRRVSTSMSIWDRVS